jgi:hypothetical protein
LNKRSTNYKHVVALKIINSMCKFVQWNCNFDANNKNKSIFCVFLFNQRYQLFHQLHNLFGHSKMFNPSLIFILHHEKIWMPWNIFLFDLIINLLGHQKFKIVGSQNCSNSITFIVVLDNNILSLTQDPNISSIKFVIILMFSFSNLLHRIRSSCHHKPRWKN